MSLIVRLQDYLRASARQRYDTVSVPPFTLYLHRQRSEPHANYAIPDGPTGGDLSEPLAQLRRAFHQRRRFPRFEFIADAAPDLAAALAAAGFVEEDRNALMVCTPTSTQAALAVPGLELVVLGGDADLRDVRDLMIAQQQAFSDDDNPIVTEDDARNLLSWLKGTTFVLARIDGQPAGGGSLLPPIAGVAEVAGIGTARAFRRRGVAAAVTARLLEVAFASQVTTAMLTAADERAGQVYARVGFAHVGTALAYIDREEHTG